MSVTSPTLSICLPTGDQLDSLKRRLAYHLHTFSLTDLSYEIVVLDDAMSEETSAYLLSLREVTNVSVAVFQQTSKISSEIDVAFRSARGEFVVVLGLADQLKADATVELVQRMQACQDLAMIQAPWIIPNVEAKQYSTHPVTEESLFSRGQFKELCDFVLSGYPFPGSMLIRRACIRANAEQISSSIHWPFLLTSVALQQGNVLFIERPFATVPAAFRSPSSGPVLRRYWDVLFDNDAYAGGLEYLAALSEIYAPLTTEPLDQRHAAISRCIANRRKAVLARLVDAKMWMEAYILIHRIAAREPLTIAPQFMRKIASLAGLKGMADDLSTVSILPRKDPIGSSASGQGLLMDEAFENTEPRPKLERRQPDPSKARQAERSLLSDNVSPVKH